MSVQYFNVTEETRYSLTVEPVKNLADVGENFYTREEIQERFGETYIPDYARRFVNRSLISSQLEKLTEQLENKAVKSVVIEDEELLEILKNEGISRYAEGVRRRGNRISRWAPRPREQKAVRKSDIAELWGALSTAARKKYDVQWLPHIPLRLRSAALMRLYKRAFGWRDLKQHIPARRRKWCHLVWQHPEDHLP